MSGHLHVLSRAAPVGMSPTGTRAPGVELRFPLDGAAAELTSFTGGVTLGVAF